MLRLVIPPLPESGPEPVLIQNLKAVGGIETRIPPEMSERRESHRLEMMPGPLADVLEERSAHTASAVVGVDAQLFEVRHTVQDIDQREATRMVSLYGDPDPASLQVGREGRDRCWFVRCDVGQTHVGEQGAGSPLDLA